MNWIVLLLTVLVPVAVFLIGLHSILKAKRRRDRALEDWYNLLYELEDEDDIELWHTLNNLSGW